MIIYHDDDKEMYIGIAGIDTTESKLIKKISKILGIDFEQSNDIPEDLELYYTMDFPVDTLLVNFKDYNEDFVELSEKGIAIYIIP